MNFGRDAQAIIDDVKKVKIRGFSTDVGDPKKYIESMLSMLRGNENVISYIIPPKGLIKTILLITDSGKLMFASVSTSVVKGALWDKTQYYYESNYVELLTLNEDETILREDKKTGFLGEVFDNLIMFFNNKSVSLELPRKQGEDVYKAIIAEKKKLLPKKESAPKKTTATKKASEPKKSEQKSDDGAAAIKEIRKMYEDNIITKEEMMELLKTQLSK